MAKFIQTNQKVNNQINAETIGVVSFNSIKDKTELVSELRKISSELNKLTKANKVNVNLAINIEAHVKKAIAEIERSEPKKDSVIENIEKAKNLLDGITSATSLVNALMQAVQIARTLLL